MNLNLEFKHALVCGASQGIGLASAIELANMGANITLMARNEEALIEAIKKLPKNGSQIHEFLVADFNDNNAVFEAINKRISLRKFDILINNTGGPAPGKAHESNIQDFRNAFDLHLINFQIITQAVLPHMKENRFGRIVNIISTSVKQPLPNLGVSNTIRGAVASWSKTLASELGPFGITVNNVLPGATGTGRLDQIIQNRSQKSGISVKQVQKEMIHEIPAGRLGFPEEIGAGVAFLCSPSAAYINGINLPIDGGRTLCL